MAGLKVEIGNLKLKNPVMAASGTFGYGKEFEGLVKLKKLGAIITKTITFEARRGNPMPRVHETASGMLNSIGLENQGARHFIKEKLPYLSKLRVPVIVSISGSAKDDFCKCAAMLDRQPAISGIELNLSCPNVKGEGMVAQDAGATYDIVSAVRGETGKVLIAKLSPNVANIVEIGQAACKAGCDAVSAINTLSGMAIDIDTRKPVLGNITGGLSGPCIKPVALKMIWDLAKGIKKPVIGIGGIMTAEDAIEFIIAGASAVQAGTANFVKPAVCEEIIKGIADYLKKNKMKSIGEIRGI